MSNAVRHTLEGDVVALGARVDDGAVLLWVRDSGPGVQPDDAERIFSRFERGSYVGYLRRKLGAGRIETVRGMGYRLVAV